MNTSVQRLDGVSSGQTDGVLLVSVERDTLRRISRALSIATYHTVDCWTPSRHIQSIRKASYRHTPAILVAAVCTSDRLACVNAKLP